MRHILCLITLVTSISYSQKIEDFSLKHSMKQDGLALQFTVLDPDKKGIRRYDTHKTYFWYKAQKVVGTQGGSSGQLLHGLYEAFYLSKQLCEKGYYEKGLKNGYWQYWRGDGSLLKTEHWRNGTQRGEQVLYSEEGLVQKRTVIRGRHITTDCGDTLIEISGRSSTVTLMDSIGRVRSVARYRDELLHGKQETIASDGTKTVVSYKRGIVKEAGKRAGDPVHSATTAPDPSVDTPKTKQPFKDRIKGIFSKKDKTANGTEKQNPAGKKEKKTKSDKESDPAGAGKRRKFNLFKRKAA